jgi:hypothetical protein
VDAEDVLADGAGAGRVLGCGLVGHGYLHGSSARTYSGWLIPPMR